MAFKCSKNIWRKAKKIAEEDYTYCISSNTNKKDYGKSTGDCCEMPEIVAEGRSHDECVINLHHKTRIAVAMILERGDVPPAPGSDLYSKHGINPMSIDDVTKAEESSLKDNICPDCSGVGFLEGPCGGGSVNVMCANDKCKARFNFIWPFTPQRLTYGIAKLDASRSLPPVTDVPPMPKCKPPKAEGRHYVNRLTANANDFDSIVSDMIKELATIQTCDKGHKFVANSHEYVCPRCSLDKYVRRIDELQKQLEQN